MSYGFPRRFDYAYPCDGPVRVGLSGGGDSPESMAAQQTAFRAFIFVVDAIPVVALLGLAYFALRPKS